MNKTTDKKIALALDTSTPVASAAIYEFDDSSSTLLYSAVLNVGLTHSQTAAKLIDSALKFTDIKPADINVFAVVNGPGSFTGVRIGISTIIAMADSMGTPMVTVSSLNSLARNIRHFDGIIVPIIDARRTNVYSAVFDADYNQLLDDGIYDINELIDKVSDISRNAIFLGDGTYRHRECIIDGMIGAQIAKGNDNMITAESALEIAIERYRSGNTESQLVNYVKSTSAIPQSQQKKKW